MDSARAARYTEPERRALRAALAQPPFAGGSRTIVGAARSALRRLRTAGVPAFLAERLDCMDQIVRMLCDRGFELPIEARLQALVALRYFAESRDPALRDGIDGLDDALIVDLVREQLAHELSAYREFCVFRRETAPARGFEARYFTRKQWFVERRKALEQQLRQRSHQHAFVPDADAPGERFQVV